MLYLQLGVTWALRDRKYLLGSRVFCSSDIIYMGSG